MTKPMQEITDGLVDILHRTKDIDAALAIVDEILETKPSAKTLNDLEKDLTASFNQLVNNGGLVENAIGISKRVRKIEALRPSR